MMGFYIVYTSDTHGRIFPVNYATGKHADGGLLNLAGQLKHALDDHTREPDFKGQSRADTLIIDGGDSLQGTPLNQYYLAHRHEYRYHPVACAFNAMGLEYYTLGNHDFNFGYDVLKEYLEAMNAQCICCNVTDLTGLLPIKKWVEHTMPDGTRVGITGCVTDWVNVWEKKENLTKLKVTDPIAAASAALDEMKGCTDYTICVYHGGFEEDLRDGHLTSDTTENLACRMMRETDFDLLLTGHQHMAVESFDLCGTHACQPPDKAGRYCSLHIEETDSGYSTVSKLTDVGNEHLEEPMNSMIGVEEATQRWLDEPIGSFSEEIPPEDKLDAALHGSRVAAFFNAVELDYTGADFACSALMNDLIGFRKQITVRDVCAAYQFSNTVMVLEVTKKTILESLERVAEYFDIRDGQIVISDRFLKPKVEHYNYDFYANLDYAFDISKPLGQRVIRLRKLDGSELSDEDTYTLVTSDYRATGTGGYPALGASRVVRSTTDEMPDLIACYVKNHSPLPEFHNYRIQVLPSRQH